MFTSLGGGTPLQFPALDDGYTVQVGSLVVPLVIPIVMTWLLVFPEMQSCSVGL